jgi:hypothetical protein
MRPMKATMAVLATTGLLAGGGVAIANAATTGSTGTTSSTSSGATSATTPPSGAHTGGHCPGR